MFWLGVLALVAPAAALQIARWPDRNERIAMALTTGLALFMFKVLRTPVGFLFHDELAHWRTLHDITVGHHLFVSNPIVPESGSYPGLEVLTNAVATMTGLHDFAASIVVLAVARFILVAAMFLVLEKAGGPRIAGIASLVYAANPNFLFFDSQYAYESLALPLAALLAYLALRPRPERGSDRFAAVAAIAVVALGLAITHHLTSWIFALGLVGILVIDRIMNRFSPQPRRMQLPATICAIAAPLLWFANVGTSAIAYVTPHLADGGSELVNIVLGDSAPRKLFTSAAVQSPKWEQLMGFGAVGLILLGLAVAGWRLVITRRLRPGSVGMFMLLACVAYPFTLALRLTEAGEESANRTSEFLYIALGFAVATTVVRILGDRRPAPLRSALIAAALTIIVGGGIVIGWARWARLPGPFIVSGDPNSLTLVSADMARWMKANLGPDHRIATDRDNGLELGAPTGEQNVLSALADHVSMVSLITNTTFDEPARQSILRAHVQYVVVDRRLSTGLPYTTVYVEDGEPVWTHPLSPKAASKFDHLGGVDRIFDDGPIQVYALPFSGR
jgi:hypothetical protein